MEKVTLYTFQDPSIKISMVLYFDEAGQLVFDGYDIGPRVKELMGDADYEYTYTVGLNEVKKLAAYFGLDLDDKMALLQAIKSRFHGHDAYSKFGAFMKAQGIGFEQFTWR